MPPPCRLQMLLSQALWRERTIYHIYDMERPGRRGARGASAAAGPLRARVWIAIGYGSTS